jgi:hypothetical protein
VVEFLVGGGFDEFAEFVFGVILALSFTPGLVSFWKCGRPRRRILHDPSGDIADDGLPYGAVGDYVGDRFLSVFLNVLDNLGAAGTAKSISTSGGRRVQGLRIALSKKAGGPERADVVSDAHGVRRRSSSGATAGSRLGMSLSRYPWMKW